MQHTELNHDISHNSVTCVRVVVMHRHVT